jgi:hypothetical protein
VLSDDDDDDDRNDGLCQYNKNSWCGKVAQFRAERVSNNKRKSMVICGKCYKWLVREKVINLSFGRNGIEPI